MPKEQIDKDLKTALLSGDKDRAEVLRGLKSSILYAELAANARATGLSEEAFLAVLTKESKKRAESAELYTKAGAQDRADKELAEKAIIDSYLPAQLDDAELRAIVDEVIRSTGANAQFGQVIGAVRQKVGAKASGGRIAAIVKSTLGN